MTNRETDNDRPNMREIEQALAISRTFHREHSGDAAEQFRYLQTVEVVLSDQAADRRNRSRGLFEHLAALPDEFADQRQLMVEQLKRDIVALKAGIDLHVIDTVLGAMRKIPRELFCPRGPHISAYLPTAINIGHEQTISHPYLVALMSIAAEPHEHATILDVGTGSGYQAAIMSGLAERVITLEIVEQLSLQAKSVLNLLGLKNIDVVTTDASGGWAPNAPYDAIIVAAASSAIPKVLLDQLKPNGRLVMPLGSVGEPKYLVVATKSALTSDISYSSLGPVHFVPFTGAHQSEVDSFEMSDWSRLPYTYGRPVTHI